MAQSGHAKQPRLMSAFGGKSGHVLNDGVMSAYDPQRTSSTSPRAAHARDADVALRALAELAVEPIGTRLIFAHVGAQSEIASCCLVLMANAIISAS